MGWGSSLLGGGANYVEFFARKAGSLQWIWLLLTGTNSLELSDEEMSSSEFFDDIQLTDTDAELEPLRIRGGNKERRYQEVHNICSKDVPASCNLQHEKPS